MVCNTKICVPVFLSALRLDWMEEGFCNFTAEGIQHNFIPSSIYGKADEVIDLLNRCKFDIFFIGESKIDGLTSNSLFSHPNYHIVLRDRKKGTGGLLVYIRSNITTRRCTALEPEGVESICLDIKGKENTSFARKVQTIGLYF